MRQAARWIVSSFVWFLWLIISAVWTLLVALVYLATAWWDEPRWYVGRTFRLGGRLLIFVNPYWRVEYEGDMPPRATMPFVGVSNHESLADVLLVGALPFDMKWLSKAEIGRVPFIGWMMRLAGDILVERSDRRSRGRSYDQMVEWIGRGASVMLFPEGTRSRTGEMLPFRYGAFRVAIETQRPIQPMAVSGTRDAIRADSLLFGRARVRVRVLAQEPTAGLTEADMDDLRDRIRDRIDEARQT